VLYHIVPLTREEAEQISTWVYKPPFSIYSFEPTEDTIQELLQDDYHAVYDESNSLCGFFCFGDAATVKNGEAFYNDDALDIGLALAPSLCGQGLGLQFLHEGVLYARKHYPQAQALRLSVLVWNLRARRLYQRYGFQYIGSFERPTPMGPVEFVVMLFTGESLAEYVTSAV